jgi:quaternary ammonium compound-resistance protein SugE
MSWVVLLVSGLFEAVWAAALNASKGFSKLYPSVVFLVALALSMAGLAYALRSIPLSVGYAVWVGVGVVGAAVYGMAAVGEPATAGRVVCIVLILAGVVGLKLL